MNKKEARRKKHEANKAKGNILDSSIIGDEEVSAAAFDAEEEETLLGNLAPVKQIPMLIWFDIPVLPTFTKKIHLSYEEGEEWLEKMLVETSAKEHDLVGFMPVPDRQNADFAVVAPGQIGMAAQVLEVEKTALKGIIIHLKGICRFENTGFLPAPREYFNIKVRWLEDDPEPDSLIQPQYFEYMKMLERLAKIGGEQMKMFTNVSTTTGYHPRGAQYASFMLINQFNWFTLKEQLELLRLTSTSERLKKINARAKLALPYMEKHKDGFQKGMNN